MMRKGERQAREAVAELAATLGLPPAGRGSIYVDTEIYPGFYAVCERWGDTAYAVWLRASAGELVCAAKLVKRGVALRERLACREEEEVSNGGDK